MKTRTPGDWPADLIGMEDHIRSIPAQPKNSHVVNFPVKMDDGRYELVRGFRIQRNNILDPYRGGILP